MMESPYLVCSINGRLSAWQESLSCLMPSDGHLVRIGATLGKRPSGQPVIANIICNDDRVLPSDERIVFEPGGEKFWFQDGEISYVQGDRFKVTIDQVGSKKPGTNLRIYLYHRAVEAPAPKYHEPPDGWMTFGTHAPLDHAPPLEFSDEVGGDGMPLYERCFHYGDLAGVPSIPGSLRRTAASEQDQAGCARS